MELENRTPDETVNYTIEHPLKEFAWLVIGAVGAIVLATFLIGVFAGELAARLPYRYEKAVAAEASSAMLAGKAGSGKETAQNIERELNRLAARLVAHMTLPEGMEVTVHYQDTPMVNAFATLGANIVFCRGLLQQLPDENAVSMVLAHEIAHAAMRHPVRSLGRGVAVGIIIAVVHSGMGRNAASGAINLAGSASLLKFSRDQEREADRAALAAVVKVYGHAGGALDVFRVLEIAGGDDQKMRVPMLNTHPLSQERIDAIARQSAENKWPPDGTRTKLADSIGALGRLSASAK